jgi:hypothetical protein
MPVHLPPLSRRQFLAGSIAAASALVAKDALWAAAEQVAADPHRFALLSDTHVAADRAAVSRGVTMARNMGKAVAEVAALSPRPAAAAVNGDLALSEGLGKDYVTLLDLLAPLRAAGVPVHLGLGNHDHRDRFRAALPEKERAATPVADRQVYRVESPRADWFVLDSLRETNEVAGALGEQQRRWLDEALAARQDKPALVVVHHNPDPKAPHGGGLTDTPELLELLARRTNVKALFFGHTHAWSVREEKGLHLINLPPVAYVFAEGYPSGWVDVRLTDAGASLELRCIDPTHPRHGEKHDLRWRPA